MEKTTTNYWKSEVFHLKIYFLVYFCIITLISIVSMGIDKVKSIKKQRRISESILMILAVIGGSLGIYLGMGIFRHKTQKNFFVFGVPFIFFIQTIIVYSIFF